MYCFLLGNEVRFLAPVGSLGMTCVFWVRWVSLLSIVFFGLQAAELFQLGEELVGILLLGLLVLAAAEHIKAHQQQFDGWVNEALAAQK